jgi:hypothetical protein
MWNTPFNYYATIAEAIEIYHCDQDRIYHRTQSPSQTADVARKQIASQEIRSAPSSIHLLAR